VPNEPSFRPRGTPGPSLLGPGAEFDLIRRFLPAAAGTRADVRVGPGDDCAVVAGEGIALSSDLSVEEVHFRRDWLSPELIGFRAAAAALSDLAAVAARPIGVMASVAVAEEDAGPFVVAVMGGVRRAADSVGAALLGGDLTRSPGPLMIDITVVGEAARPVLRSGAHHGDEVWVTGELGGAAACVSRLLEGRRAPRDAWARFAEPRARVREARWLAERGLPTAMLDLSDGLAGDAAHLAAASKVAVLLVPELIPVHPAAARARSRRAALAMALGGGEDYELCFTAAPGTVEAMRRDFEQCFELPLRCVGRVGHGDGVWWVDPEGHRTPMDSRGFGHFHDPR
jgi:thiamine-monophosphate kinase